MHTLDTNISCVCSETPFTKSTFVSLFNMNNLILFDFYDLLPIYLSQKNTTRLSHFIPHNEKKHLIKHYAKSFLEHFNPTATNQN